MFCKKCGNQIDDDSAFCYKCGTAVSKVIQENVHTSEPTQYVQTNVPTQNVQTITPVQNMQTNTPAPIPKIPAKGTEVTLAAPIPSKYKIGKIITMIVFIGISLFIDLPEENWVLLIIMFIISAAFLGLIGWNTLSAVTMFIIRKIEKEPYASYIESESTEKILKLIAKPLAEKDIDAMLCKKGSNVIMIDYQERIYELYFFKEGYFNIAPDRPVYMHDIEGFKIIKMPFIYEHSLEDFPIIAYCVQEILKKA